MFSNYHAFSEDQIIYHSEYLREHIMLNPIGQPLHCEPSAPKSNRTISNAPQTLCPSFCAVMNGLETGKLNQVSDMPDAHEIPENADIIETSTTFKVQKTTVTTTTKLLPVERKIESNEPSTTLSENLNHTLVEQTTAKDKIDLSSQGPLATDDQIINTVNKIAIQAEQPVEVRESAIISPNTPSPILQSNYSENIEGQSADLLEVPKKPNQPKDLSDTNTEFKPQENEPLLSDEHVRSPKFLENDIKSTFNKKSENKFERAVPDVEVAKSPNTNVESLTPQIPVSTPTYGIPVEASNPACIIISLLIRSESFNMTLGSDEICQNFNITYNIPLSKYMKENRFELVFM